MSTTVPSACCQPWRRSDARQFDSSVAAPIARPMMKIRMPASVAPSRCSPGRLQPHGTAHAGAAEPAVAVRILRQVLLVVVLGVVELRRRKDFRRDRAVAALRQRALILVAGALRRRALRRIVEVDAGAILRA